MQSEAGRDSAHLVAAPVAAAATRSGAPARGAAGGAVTVFVKTRLSPEYPEPRLPKELGLPPLPPPRLPPRVKTGSRSELLWRLEGAAASRGTKFGSLPLAAAIRGGRGWLRFFTGAGREPCQPVSVPS